MLFSGVLPIAQADVTKQAQEMPNSRRIDIASDPSLAFPPRAQDALRYSMPVLLAERGNAVRWEPAYPRRNRAFKVTQKG
jgi:hypothetical protein